MRGLLNLFIDWCGMFNLCGAVHVGWLGEEILKTWCGRFMMNRSERASKVFVEQFIELDVHIYVIRYDLR